MKNKLYYIIVNNLSNLILILSFCESAPQKLLKNISKVKIKNMTAGISSGFALKENMNEDIKTTISNAEKKCMTINY